MAIEPLPLRSMAPAEPAHVAHWLALSNDTVALFAALERTRIQAEHLLPRSVWIRLCPPDEWQAQLDLLKARIAEQYASVAPQTQTMRSNPVLTKYPLLGVPFAVKDNIDIAGQPTTAACPAFAFTPQHSATAVQKLLDAGALWVGKTNLDQFATGLVGARSPYGRPASVADADRVSGGSSSGSAIAVAAGVVPFALGTDTAGSGRIPAGFNGLVGLKPTPGRVSTAGVLPACRTLDCVSIFAHTVSDAEHVLSVIEGPDAQDAYSSFAPGRANFGAGPGIAIGANAGAQPKLRVGLPKSAALDPEPGYPAAWQRARQHAETLGFELVDIDMAPFFAVAALLYEGPWVAERHTVVRELLNTQPDALDPTVRQVISRANGFSATDTFAAQYRLADFRKDLANFWQTVDVLLVPTAPHHPRFADLDADPVGVNARLGTYTNFVNLLGWSALAVSAGTTEVGLPFGVTFISGGGADVGLANLARRWLGEAAQPHSLRHAATAPEHRLAVVGAHLFGLPLNGQLVALGARLECATHSAPAYRLFALPGGPPRRPGLLRVAEGGVPIALEVWTLPQAHMGAFLAQIPAPLGLGQVELEDGTWVQGFLCEAYAVAGAQDISALGGWRAYLASIAPAAGPAPGSA